MINRYELVSWILFAQRMDESFRKFIASQPDEVLLDQTGLKEVRKGYYSALNFS